MEKKNNNNNNNVKRTKIPSILHATGMRSKIIIIQAVLTGFWILGQQETAWQDPHSWGSWPQQAKSWKLFAVWTGAVDHQILSCRYFLCPDQRNDRGCIKYKCTAHWHILGSHLKTTEMEKSECKETSTVQLYSVKLWKASKKMLVCFICYVRFRTPEPNSLKRLLLRTFLRLFTA